MRAPAAGSKGGRGPGWRFGRWVLVVASLALCLSLGGARPGWAEGSLTSAGNFSAVAQADGARYGMAAPGFSAIDPIIDAGGPSAQASLDSLGNSRAFGSVPYPGEAAVSAPGLIAGLTGVNVPGYPFYAESSAPAHPEGKVEGPGFELAARSSDHSSLGSVSLGSPDGPVSGVQTLAEVKRHAGSDEVSAEARTLARGIDVGGILRIGEVRAVARAVRDPGAEPKRTSSFDVVAASIAGRSVGVSAAGLEFSGQTVPLSGSASPGDVLSEHGIEMRYLQPAESPAGVVAAGLWIRFVGGPPMSLPGLPETTVHTLVLGRAAAMVDNSSVELSIVDLGSGFVGVDPASPLPLPVGPPEGLPAPVSDGFEVPAPAPGLESEGTASVAPSGEGPEEAIVPPLTAHLPSRRRSMAPFSVAGFYPVLMAGGLVTVMSGLAFRRIR